jgi:hypothetical protein
MRKLVYGVVLCLFIPFVLSGCLTTPEYKSIEISVNDIKPNTGEEKIIGMGDLFLEHSSYSGTAYDFPYSRCSGGETVGSNLRIDLTLVGLSKETITLQYSEYFKELCGPNAYNRYGSWLVKEGYNKRFDYSVEGKIITFKEYEFAILSIENGKLKYKRLK